MGKPRSRWSWKVRELRTLKDPACASFLLGLAECPLRGWGDLVGEGEEGLDPRRPWVPWRRLDFIPRPWAVRVLKQLVPWTNWSTVQVEPVGHSCRDQGCSKLPLRQREVTLPGNGRGLGARKEQRVCADLAAAGRVDTGEPAGVRNKKLRGRMRDEKQREDGDVHLGVHTAWGVCLTPQEMLRCWWGEDFVVLGLKEALGWNFSEGAGTLRPRRWVAAEAGTPPVLSCLFSPVRCCHRSSLYHCIHQWGKLQRVSYFLSICMTFRFNHHHLRLWNIRCAIPLRPESHQDWPHHHFLLSLCQLIFCEYKSQKKREALTPNHTRISPP